MIFAYLTNHSQVFGLLGFWVFSFVRLKSYLHIFQQEEYENFRFLKWVLRTGSFDRIATIVVVALSLIDFVIPKLPGYVSGFAVALLFAGIAHYERAHQKTAKKPLVMTSRATRIFQISFVTSLFLALVLAALSVTPPIWLIAIHSCPFLLVGANVLLSPVESRLKANYWREAHGKLRRLNPTIVGITGSYGKTSVKHILGHVLQFHGPTLITPGSINTPMGISRIVREQLRPSHKFFVAEMGAYGPGSIEALCNLAPPKLGILTAIGSAHLERFGSKDVTARAKMELASAVLAAAGKMIINSDIADLPAVRDQLSTHRSSFITCGIQSGEICIDNIVQTQSGLEFSLSFKGDACRISVPLFGRHQALNVAFVYAAARELGMTSQDIVNALRTTPQISHRLEVRRQSNGAIIIDDAYNSNPAGFSSALELLGTLKKQGGKAVLITPGMVELGADHEAEHFKLGELASRCADEIYVVGKSRIPTFVQGVRSRSNGCNVVSFKSFASAQEKLMMSLGSQDVVLIENDLPDLYERRMFL